ncbi:MAG: hypothetical protein K9J17_07870 [Flavobacteriales bacterium]|nr:hypothetical protein [Flavobacteriales bacterium]
MEKIKNISSFVAVVMILSMLMVSCTSTHQARKCDGRRAIHTPMGPM